ncbi:hypothetical protein HDF15_001365 [Granulicella mallensis]|uniref:Uncharacterized protein n=1 Tax=Granulicella mallensis TaxID=940614 RepID=A0A7W7ZN65_9BACT|nr:hypothetical protein [Granulicella mallensis]
MPSTLPERRLVLPSMATTSTPSAGRRLQIPARRSDRTAVRTYHAKGYPWPTECTRATNPAFPWPTTQSLQTYPLPPKPRSPPPPTTPPNCALPCPFAVDLGSIQTHPPIAADLLSP